MKDVKLPYVVWMKEVKRMSKMKFFDSTDMNVLRECWESGMEPIVGVTVVHDLNNGGDGIAASGIDDEEPYDLAEALERDGHSSLAGHPGVRRRA